MPFPFPPLLPANANYHDGNSPVSSELLVDDLIDRVEGACESLLIALGIDFENDPNTKDTPHRMAKMYVTELLKGRYLPKPDLREFPNQRGLDQLYTVGPIAITSLCSHHFLPFTGHCFVGILPTPEGSVLGLSKFARMAEWIFARPQIQEEATIQLADLLEDSCHPAGLALVVRAEHQCMTLRGAKQPGSKMTTSVMRGVMREDAKAREEFFQLLRAAGF